MKLQIDTSAKVIKIEESVNFGELIEKIKKLLPNEWKDYKLETDTVIQWRNPVVIQDWPLYPKYPNWWTQPYYSTGGTVMGETKITTDSVTIDTSQQNQYCIEC